MLKIMGKKIITYTDFCFCLSNHVTSTLVCPYYPNKYFICLNLASAKVASPESRYYQCSSVLKNIKTFQVVSQLHSTLQTDGRAGIQDIVHTQNSLWILPTILF